MSQVTILGYIGKDDAEISETTGGYKLVKFSMGAPGRNREWSNYRVTIFLSDYDKSDENFPETQSRVREYRHGGRTLAVTGDLVIRKFERSDGSQGSSAEITCNGMRSLFYDRRAGRDLYVTQSKESDDDVPF